MGTVIKKAAAETKQAIWDYNPWLEENSVMHGALNVIAVIQTLVVKVSLVSSQYHLRILSLSCPDKSWWPLAHALFANGNHAPRPITSACYAFLPWNYGEPIALQFALSLSHSSWSRCAVYLSCSHCTSLGHVLLTHSACRSKLLGHTSNVGNLLGRLQARPLVSAW